MMKCLFLMFLFVILTLVPVQSAKILGIFPFPSSSHYILGNSLLKGLAEKGHDVTMVSPYEEKNPPKSGSYRDVTLTGAKEEQQGDRRVINMLNVTNVSPFVFVPFMAQIGIQSTVSTLNHNSVQELLRSNEKFDVVIVDQALNEAHKGFACHFGAPLILLSSLGANIWINDFVGNTGPISYIPDVMLSFSSNMTLWERIQNTLMYVLWQAINRFYLFPKQEEIYNKFFPKCPPFYETLYNTSIVLLNSHPSLNQPVPYVPSLIDIGGFHVQAPKKLPEDLQQWLDDAKEGVIYFSMGSYIRSTDLPEEIRETLLKTFAKLKQKVLWKWEDDVLPGQPPNVKLGKWLPQQDILAHPNVKLFISHGGLLSTIEAMHHAVPVLAIPIAVDQKLNAHRMADQGVGLTLSYNDISEKTLTDKLQEIVTNPKYTQNVKKVSQLFHDRLMKPMDTAVYWVEYVVRHGGAPHLKVAAVDLPLYKYFLLDVIAALLVGILFSLYLTKVVLKKLFSVCKKPKKEKKLKTH